MLVLGAAYLPFARAADSPPRDSEATPLPWESPAAGRMLASKAQKVDGYVRLDFDRLAAFKFAWPGEDDYAPEKKDDPPPQWVLDHIPTAIKKFDGQKAVITGFLLPAHEEADLDNTTEFYVFRTDPMELMDHHGHRPISPNEYVFVRMPKGIKITAGQVSVFGKFHVGGRYENKFLGENTHRTNCLTSIYQLEGERLAEQKR